MEMKFDPMTGEPISSAPQPQMKFDPMTGQPIQSENVFDPFAGSRDSGSIGQAASQVAGQTSGQASGQSIGQAASQMAGQTTAQASGQSIGQAASQMAGQTSGFDPMTGQPIQSGKVFDPFAGSRDSGSIGQAASQIAGQTSGQASGQSIGQAASQVAGQTSGFDPMTGQPIQSGNVFDPFAGSRGSGSIGQAASQVAGQTSGQASGQSIGHAASQIAGQTSGFDPMTGQPIQPGKVFDPFAGSRGSGSIGQAASQVAGQTSGQVSGQSIGHAATQVASQTAGFDPMTGQPIKVAAQAASQATGHAGGQAAGQTIGQAAGQVAGQTTGQAAGQTIGQAAGQVAGQTAGQAAGQTIGQAAGQVAGQTAGQAAGQTIGQAAGQTAAQTAAQGTIKVGAAKIGAAKIGAGVGTKVAGSIGLKLGIVAAAVVVGGGGAYAGVKSGTFLSPSGKVALAMSNTLSDAPEIIEDINVSSILSSDKYTVGAEGSYSGQKVAMAYRCASDKKQLEMTLDLAGSSDFTGYVTLDSEAISLAMPDLVDDTLIYYYTANNNGALMEELDDDVVEQINNLLTTLASEKQSSAELKKFKTAVTDEYKSLKFTKISSQQFEVDGKDRTCTGYRVTITPDNLNNIVEAYMDYLDEMLPEGMDNYISSSDIAELEREIDDLDDIELEFYIYNNKIACIATEIEGYEVQLLFLGGDYRMQNMELNVEDTTYLKLVGEKEGTEETLKLKAMGETVAKVDYDTKSGEFKIVVNDFSVKGTIESNKKGVTVNITKISEIDGLKLSVYALNSADFVTISDKHLFDLGNAELEEFYDLEDDFDASALESLSNVENLYYLWMYGF